MWKISGSLKDVFEDPSFLTRHAVSVTMIRRKDGKYLPVDTVWHQKTRNLSAWALSTVGSYLNKERFKPTILNAPRYARSFEIYFYSNHDKIWNHKKKTDVK
jgi:hypothetical protein